MSRIESLALEIAEHFEQIAKKHLELGALLGKSGEYWEAAERRAPEAPGLAGLPLSESLKSLKAACLSSSASLAKPAELFKASIHHFSRNNRKCLEPLAELMGLRAQLAREFNEEVKKLVAAGEAEFDRHKKPRNVRAAHQPVLAKRDVQLCNLSLRIGEVFAKLHAKCSEQALSELRSFAKELQTHLKEVRPAQQNCCVWTGLFDLLNRVGD